MEELLPLLQRIKNLRSRAAEELPTLCGIGLECIEAMKSAEVQATTLVEHKGRTYTLLQTGAADQIRIARPVRKDLFIWDIDEIGILVREVCGGPWESAKARDLERLTPFCTAGRCHVSGFVPAVRRAEGSGYIL